MDRRKLRRLLASSSFAAILIASQSARGQSDLTNPAGSTTAFLRVNPAEVVEDVRNFGLITNDDGDPGIEVIGNGTVLGEIDNDGTIALSDTLTATGIIVHGISAAVGDSISNDGLIQIEASVLARGIVVEDTGTVVSGNDDGRAILNDGTVDLLQRFVLATAVAVTTRSTSVSRTETGEGAAVGIFIGSDATLNGIVENRGDLLVKGSNDVALAINVVATTGDGTVNGHVEVDEEAAGVSATGALLPGFTNSGSIDVAVVSKGSLALRAKSEGDALVDAGLAIEGHATGVELSFDTLAGDVLSEGGIDVRLSQSAKVTTTAIGAKATITTAQITSTAAAVGLHLEGTQVDGGVHNDGDIAVDVDARAVMAGKATGEGPAKAEMVLTTHDVTALGIVIDVDTILGSFVNEGSVDVAATGFAKVDAKAVSTGDAASATADAIIDVEASGISLSGDRLSGGFVNEGAIGVHAGADLSAIAFASNVAGKSAFAVADGSDGRADVSGLVIELDSATGAMSNAGDVRASASYVGHAKATALGDTAAHAVANLSASAGASGIRAEIDTLNGSLSNAGDVVAIAKIDINASASASASGGKATATARFLHEKRAEAGGVQLFMSTLNGNLTNSGSVLVQGTAAVDLLAKAQADTTAIARVSNFFGSGSILARASGVALEAREGGDLSNHGDISAHAIATVKASALAAGNKATALADLTSFPLGAAARGLEFDGISGGTIHGSIANSGDVRAISEMEVSLKADATAESGPAFARARLVTPQFFAAALDIDASTVEGTIENSGDGVAIAGANLLLAATATGEGAAVASITLEAVEASAFGFDLSADVAGPVHNSGSFLVIVGLTVDMRASAVGSAAKALAPNPHFIDLSAVGMRIEGTSFDGGITNSGDLTGEAVLSARATFGLEAYAKGSNAATASAIWRSMQVAAGRGFVVDIDTMTGDVTNHGAVQGGAALGLRASATALMESGGTAHAKAAIFTGTAEATGFTIVGETLTGNISNDGEFILADAVGFLAVKAKASATVAGDASATAKVDGISVLANGIDIDVTQLHGSVANRGEVTAVARISGTVSALAAGEGGKASAVFQADSLFANAYDVNGQTIDGDVRNSGALFAGISMHLAVKATMNGSGNAIAGVGSQIFRAEGMEVEFTAGAAGVGGSVTNSANITASALLAVTAAAQAGGLVQANIATQAAQAFGLAVNANLIDGGVSNSGRVLAFASAHGKADGDGGVSARIKATAQAMSVGSNDMHANVINDGTLYATAVAAASAFAHGGSGTAKAAAQATGLRVALGNFFGGVENNGLIRAKASAAATATADFGQVQSAVARAIGVQASATIQAEGGLINRGTILASAKAGAPALAIGQVIVDTGVWHGALSNTADGQISVFASDVSKATAIGMAIRGGAWVQGGVVNAGTIRAEAVSGSARAIAIDLSQATNKGHVIEMLDGALVAVTHFTAPSLENVGTAVLMDGNGQADELDWSGGLIVADIIGDSLDKIDVFAGVDDVLNFSEVIDGVGEINLNTAAHAATPVEWRINGLVSQYNDFNVNENGTLVVGTRARIVGTSYNQDADARVIFEIAPGNGNNGTIEPNLGHLDGTIGVRPLAGLFFDTQTHLVIIGNVTGAFDNTEINTPLLSFTVEQNSPDVVLTVTRNAFGSVPGLTHNERELADALDDLYDPNALGDSELGEDIGELFTLNTDELLDAYNELHGAEFAQMAYAGFEQMQFMQGGISQRLQDARTRTGGAGQSASLGDQSLQYAAIGADEGIQGTQMASIGNDPDHPGSVWGKGYGSWGTLDGDDEAPGYDRTTGSIVVGLDYRFDSDFLVGIAGAYSFSNMDFDDGDNGDIDSFQIGLFGSWDSGTWYVDGMVSYAFQSYDTERNINFGTIDEKAKADYNGGAAQVYGEVGYQFQVGEQALITPLLGLGWTGVWTEDFKEKGANGANLSVDDASYDSLATTLGVRGSLSLGGFEPSLFLGWRHEFLDDHGEADVAFTAVPDSQWQVIGSDVGSDAGLVGVGLVAEISDQFEVMADYSGQFSGSGSSNTGSIGLRFKF